LLLLCVCQHGADLNTNENENELPVTSRTLTAAFVGTAELFTAVENTKLMWTQRQRQSATNMRPSPRSSSSSRALSLQIRIAVPLDGNHFPGPDMLCHAFPDEIPPIAATVFHKYL
jgi:hypothetical protein